MTIASEGSGEGESAGGLGVFEDAAVVEVADFAEEGREGRDGGREVNVFVSRENEVDDEERERRERRVRRPMMEVGSKRSNVGERERERLGRTRDEEEEEGF